jgi:putative restriction endonuclease
MHSRNESVIDLAQQLGRTPSSIALKLVNFASLDKVHQSRGIAGMSNSSKLDKEIWNAVHADWNLLIELSPDLGASEVGYDEPAWTGATNASAIIKIRKGQQFFRSCVLSKYKFSCAITGIKCPELLRASHIIPWRVREDTRVEPRNGICLNTLHDAAFDRGLVTFDNKLKLVLSNRLKEQMPVLVFDQMFKAYEGQSLTKPERFAPSEEYFDFHRCKIFSE